ncbi:MAG TPA: rod shape-determining protein MreD [Rhodanobacteraceae bacterium]|nr:rod shape-determining protein MreD [Rhodanobacteraceae bacterium]
MKRLPWGQLLPGLSVAFALLLMLAEWPPSIAAFKPYWPALVLVYWLLESPDHFGLGSAFVIGLVADLFTGSLLGEQALRLLVLAFIVLRFRSRLRFFPMWQQTLAVLALLFNDRILLLMVRGFAGDALPPLAYWLAPFSGALLWPFVFLLLDGLRARARAHD